MFQLLPGTVCAQLVSPPAGGLVEEDVGRTVGVDLLVGGFARN